MSSIFRHLSSSITRRSLFVLYHPSVEPHRVGFGLRRNIAVHWSHFVCAFIAIASPFGSPSGSISGPTACRTTDSHPWFPLKVPYISCGKWSDLRVDNQGGELSEKLVSAGVHARLAAPATIHRETVKKCLSHPRLQSCTSPSWIVSTYSFLAGEGAPKRGRSASEGCT